MCRAADIDEQGLRYAADAVKAYHLRLRTAGERKLALRVQRTRRTE
jgi:hypothetical protein